MDFYFCDFCPAWRDQRRSKEFCGKNNCRRDDPVFQICRFSDRKKRRPFFLFRNKQSLEEELNYLKEKNIELENEAVLLESAKKKMKN